MKKFIFVMVIIVSSLTLAAKKDKQAQEIPDIEVQMAKADKIESYKLKKDYQLLVSQKAV